MKTKPTGKGFELVEGGLFPTLDFRLDGVTISPKELVKIAEQMRQQLAELGYLVEIKSTKAG